MMRRQWLKVSTLAVLFAGALIAALALLPIDELMLPSWEGDIKDWRTYVLSPRAPEQRRDIAIVLVSEDSLNRYPYRSPVDRRLQAALIRDLDSAGVRAIGLDFIYDRPTWPDKDAILLAAIKTAKVPIVIGALDQRATGEAKWARAYQAQFLREAGRPVGHLFFGATGDKIAIGDSVIRHAAPEELSDDTGTGPLPIAGTRSASTPSAGTRQLGAGEQDENRLPKSFARALAELEGPKPPLKNSRIAWLRPPSDDSSELFATFSIPAHDPIQVSDNNAVANSNVADLLAGLPRVLPETWAAALKGKIVVVGGNLYDTDQHLTPFSVSNRQKVPGVTIHAQLLAQIIDGRAVTVLRPRLKLALVGLLAFVGVLLGWRLELKRYEIPIAVLGTALIIGLGAFAYWSAQLIIPSSLFTAWLAGGTAGHLARGIVPLHGNPAGTGEAKQNEVTT